MGRELHPDALKPKETTFAKLESANSVKIGEKRIVKNCPFPGVATVCLECKSDGTATGKWWDAGEVKSTSAFPGIAAFPSDWKIDWLQA